MSDLSFFTWKSSGFGQWNSIFWLILMEIWINYCSFRCALKCLFHSNCICSWMMDSGGFTDTGHIPARKASIYKRQGIPHGIEMNDYAEVFRYKDERFRGKVVFIFGFGNFLPYEMASLDMSLDEMIKNNHNNDRFRPCNHKNCYHNHEPITSSFCFSVRRENRYILVPEATSWG